jgi:hypothetical protein
MRLYVQMNNTARPVSFRPRYAFSGKIGEATTILTPGATLADQMNFEFRMMVPAGEGVGVVVLVPSKAMIGLRKNDFQFGGSLLEQGCSAIRHVMPLL